MKLISLLLETVPLELLICLGLVLLLQAYVSGGGFSSRKSVLAHARWAGSWEISNALRTAQKQAKERKIDKTALFIGTMEKGWKPHLNIFLGKKNNFIPLPHMQRSLLGFGTPNAGKTSTIGIPLAKDIIRRNLGSIILFDPKCDLAPIFAPFADAHGYDNYFLAPGRDYTDSINVFDFFDRPEWLSSIAEQAAETTVVNTKGKKANSSDPFFADSGKALLRSVLMLTQLNFPDPNLITVKEILALPDLIDRLRFAEEEKRISPWVLSSMRQFMSNEASERTAANIQSTATLVFDGFIRPEFVNCFANPKADSVPLDLTEKQMIIIQPMRGFEDVCLPIQSTFMDLQIERNFSQARDKPLFLIIDEAHLLLLPRIERWLAFLRSSGLVIILLTQAASQLEKIYGELDYKTIYNTTGTKIIMNPDDIDTANATANRLGDTEVRYEQKSRSRARSGSSRSQNEQIQKVPLKSAAEINKMDVGEFVLFNWGYKKGGKVGIPWNVKYKVPQYEFDIDDACKKIWKDKYLQSLRDKAKKNHLTSEEKDKYLSDKIQEVQRVLPPRPEPTNNQDKTEKDKIANDDIHNLKPQEIGILQNNANALPLP